MEITLFYTKNQRERLWESGLKPDMVYFLRGKPIPEDEWENINIEQLGEFPGLVEILKEIGKMKKIIDPVVDEYVGMIDCHEVREIVEYVTKSPSWRERPLIMRLLAKALGAEFTESLIHASAGVELFEESAILLDDVLDDAEMCVGKETSWKKYGIKETFLAHGILTSLARSAILESCNKANLDLAQTSEILSSFEEIYHGDYVGQYMDLMSEKQLEFSESQYFEMISKTPGTQFANALKTVCILVDKESQKANMREFGRLFGMAAQLRDDIIDIIGEEEVVFKKLLTDIKRRKKRLPLILFLQRYPEFRDTFARPALLIDDSEVFEIQKRMNEIGVIEECISQLCRLVNKAKVLLSNIEDGNEKELLLNLVITLANFHIY